MAKKREREGGRNGERVRWRGGYQRERNKRVMDDRERERERER